MHPPAAQQTPTQTFTATAVLLTLPRFAHTPVAVLTEGPVPASLRLDVHSSRDVFVRIRRGPGMHGLWEPYRELAYDEVPAESAVVANIGADRYVQARFPYSASVFGAVDAVALVPRDAAGAPFARVRIPVPSLDQDSWHAFELASASRTECRYRVVRDEQLDATAELEAQRG